MITSNLPQKRWIIRFLVLLLLTFGTGFFLVSFLQTPDQMIWYQGLKHSSVTPPAIVFSIVWTILYLLIPISATLVWDKGGRFYFFLQLVLQILWSYTYFVRHLLWPAFGVLALLCVVVGLMTLSYANRSKLAGLLLLPYFVWGLFAAYLNLMTAILN